MRQSRLTGGVAAVGHPAGAIGILGRFGSTRDGHELADALAILYQERFDKFVRVAVAILGDRDAGTDAVQEAFARALTKRFNFRGTSSLETWVWRILMNVCHDIYRRRARDDGCRVDEVPETTQVSDAELLDTRAAIRSLPERQRLVLFLRHYAELDYQSIAKIIGVERGTVAATLNSARTSLARAIAERRTND